MAFFRLKSGRYYDKEGNRYVPGDVVECNSDEIPIAFAHLFEKVKNFKPEKDNKE